MANIMKISRDKKLDIRGGIVLDGFPSTSTINSIASRCLILPDFQAAAIIPKQLVRLYPAFIVILDL
jgi:hypothetical protein